MSGHIAGAWILRERVPAEFPPRDSPPRARRRHAAPSTEVAAPAGRIPAQRRPRGTTLLMRLAGTGATVRAAVRAALTPSRAGRHAPTRTTVVG
jgi:hypothetical protein